MTGYAVLIDAVFVAWCSRIQKTIIILVTEAEYSEIVEVCYKILYICVTLLFMGVVFEYPITMHVDNFGSIFLS